MQGKVFCDAENTPLQLCAVSSLFYWKDVQGLILFKTRRILCFFYLLVAAVFPAVYAEVVHVPANGDLQHYLDSTPPQSTLQLANGKYVGQFVVTKPLTLLGNQNTVIDAQGTGNAITLKASDVTISRLSVVNWGEDLTAQNAGIFSKQTAHNILLKDNQLQGKGFGIWLQNASNSVIEGNHIRGDNSMRLADRGNGIQLTGGSDNLVQHNDVSQVRDGLYVINSRNNRLLNNTMHDLRFGVHYMYSYDNIVAENLTYDTRVGYAMMSSRNLDVYNNTSRDSDDYGFLLNFITYSDIHHNHIEDAWIDPEFKVVGRDGKGFFVYNSAYNTIRQNFIYRTQIGIHLTAGSENTQVYGNSFLATPLPVKYVSNKQQEWSKEQKGNFWSHYVGWDLDKNNTGDIAYVPNDGIDKLVWQYPEMKLLLDSPTVLILRWVQKQFPVLKQPGVQDSFPLMQLPDYHRDNLARVMTNKAQGGQKTHDE